RGSDAPDVVPGRRGLVKAIPEIREVPADEGLLLRLGDEFVKRLFNVHQIRPVLPKSVRGRPACRPRCGSEGHLSGVGQARAPTQGRAPGGQGPGRPDKDVRGSSARRIVAVADAGSAASSITEITPTPAAPASSTGRTSAGPTPPMAMTGIRTVWQTS